MYYNILPQKDHPKYHAVKKTLKLLEIVESAYEKMQWMMSEVKLMYQQYAEQTKKIFKEYGNQ